MPIFNTQSHSGHNSTSPISSGWFSANSWVTTLNRQLDAWYNTAAQTYSMARHYVVDEPMAYSPEPYLPQETKLSIDMARAYRNRIKAIKQGLKAKQFSLDWITILRSLFELVEQGKLSALIYEEGLEKLEKASNGLPNELKSWIDHARNELAKLKQTETWAIEQFRLGIYDGLMQVINNKITPKEWLAGLDQFENSVPEDLFELIMVDIESFCHRYCENVEQHATSVYEVPASVYRELFTDIEKQFTEDPTENEELVGKADEEQNTLITAIQNNTNHNLLANAKEVFSWMWNHKTETAIFSLAATAFYKSTCLSEENNFAPINFVSNFAVVFGTQQIIQFRGNTFAGILLPTFYSLIQPALSQNITFLGTAWNETSGDINSIVETMDGGFAVTGNINQAGSGADIALTKLSSNGTHLWTRVLDKSLYDVAFGVQETSDGSLVVAGRFLPISAYHGFLAKWFSNGTLDWAKSFGEGEAGANDYPLALKSMSNNELIAVGHTSSAAGQGAFDIFLTKFLNNGTFLEAFVIGSTGYQYGLAAEETIEGRLVIAGYNDPSGTGISDLLLIQCWSNGTFEWGVNWGGNGNDMGYAVVETTDGGFVVAGESNSFSNKTDASLTKISDNGTLIWSTILSGINNTYAYGVKETLDGRLIVNGDTFFLDTRKIFLAEFSNNGSYLGARLVGNGTSYAIQLTANGGWILGGSLNQGNGGNFLATFEADGNTTINCVTPFVNFTAVDVTSLVNITNVNFTSNIWNVTINDLMANETSLSFTAQYPCSPTPAPTANPTPVTTTASPTANPTTSSSAAPTEPVGSPSKTGDDQTIPIAVGAAVGGAFVLGLGIGGAAWFFKKRKNSKNPPNPDAFDLQSRPAPDTDVIYANGALITVSPQNQYLPFLTSPNQPKIPAIYATFIVRDVSEKYELLPKINKQHTIFLKEQTGLNIVFPKGVEKVKFVLGSGQFGELYIAQDKQTKKFVCVKEIREKDKISDSQLEAQKQKKLNGLQNIMPLLDSILTEKDGQQILYQFMPLAGFGNGLFLRQALAACQDTKLKEQILAQVTYGLLTGFKNMHEKQIYHMDFKPANFVIDQWGEMYIIDFGCAIELKEGVTQGSLGDSNYFSPERLSSYRSPQEFDAGKSDGWSLGLALLELALNRYPFDVCSADEKLKKWGDAYFKGKIGEFSELQDPDVNGLWIVIKGLLAMDPKKRLKIHQALNMPIFTEVKLQFASKEEGKKQMDRFKELVQSQTETKPTKPNNTKEEIPSRGYQFSPSVTLSPMSAPSSNDATSVVTSNPIEMKREYENVSRVADNPQPHYENVPSLEQAINHPRRIYENVPKGKGDQNDEGNDSENNFSMQP